MTKRTGSSRSVMLASLVSLAAVAGFTGGCKKGDSSADGGTSSGGGLLSGIMGEVFGTAFEGAITMHASTRGNPAGEDITFLAKGNKIRFDAPSRRGEQSHVIFEGGSKKIDMIMDTQKAYMEMDLATIQSAAGALGGKNAPAIPSAQATVTKTGKHEKIAGYDCEDWDIKEAGGRTAQACIADGIPFIDFASLSPGTKSVSSWMTELHDKRLFPLKTIENDAQGKEEARMEVTKIEKKSLDDSTFAIPAGYKKIEMPNFGALGGAGVPGLAPPPHK